MTQNDSTLKIALCSFSFLREAGLIVVPEHARADMIEAGAAAGQTDRETAMRIYKAMTAAAFMDPAGTG